MAFRNKFPSFLVEKIENGEEALPIFNGRSPDLLFLDILFPEEDGLHLPQKIKRDFPKIRIAMLTNFEVPAPEEGIKKALLGISEEGL